jgi:hypothetical protein
LCCQAEKLNIDKGFKYSNYRCIIYEGDRAPVKGILPNLNNSDYFLTAKSGKCVTDATCDTSKLVATATTKTLCDEWIPMIDKTNYRKTIDDTKLRAYLKDMYDTEIKTTHKEAISKPVNWRGIFLQDLGISPNIRRELETNYNT